MNRITEITKRDILDLLRNGLEIDEFFETKTVKYYYFGRLEEIDFLKRIYDLKKMRSNDSRFKDAEGDIWQHTVNNDDYPFCWVFEDERFELTSGSDEIYLKFIWKYFILLLDTIRGIGKKFWQKSISYCKVTDMRFTLLKKYLTVMSMGGEYFSRRKIRYLFHILNEMRRK